MNELCSSESKVLFLLALHTLTIMKGKVHLVVLVPPRLGLFSSIGAAQVRPIQ